MPYTTLLIMAAGSLAVLYFFWKSGRITNYRHFIGTALVILAGVVGLGFLEAKAERQARDLLSTVFPAPPGSQELIFYRKSTKGKRMQEIEAVYTIGSADPVQISLDGAGFRYRLNTSTASLGMWTVDQFEIADGALDWKELPRRPAPNGFFPGRGHYSSSNWPYEREMSGSYLCALVILDPDRAEAPQKVVACDTVQERPTESILILAVMDTKAGLLHLLLR